MRGLAATQANIFFKYYVYYGILVPRTFHFFFSYNYRGTLGTKMAAVCASTVLLALVHNFLAISSVLSANRWHRHQ